MTAGRLAGDHLFVCISVLPSTTFLSRNTNRSGSVYWAISSSHSTCMESLCSFAYCNKAFHVNPEHKSVQLIMVIDTWMQQAIASLYWGLFRWIDGLVLITSQRNSVSIALSNCGHPCEPRMCGLVTCPNY